jgi:hypothetical protein
MAKPKMQGKAEVSSGISKSNALAKQAFGKTLPWKVKVQFFDDNGDFVFAWTPDITIRAWEDKVTLSFSATDLSIDTR